MNLRPRNFHSYINEEVRPYLRIGFNIFLKTSLIIYYKREIKQFCVKLLLQLFKLVFLC